MDDLFPPKPVELTWKPSTKHPAPAINLQELVLLETVIPFSTIRRIPFHPGLNIVWADPKIATAKKGGSRLAGHSAGKSTFCRIIRWLLGETRFGKDELQQAIGKEFRKGMAALRLEINGTPWIVGRSFWDSNEYWAAEGTSLEEALSSGVPQKHSLPEFLAALEKISIAPLIRQNLPGSDEHLHWTDVLAWLARDQNCALQRVEAWRETQSPADKNIASKEARHILMRLILELLDDREWLEMKTSTELEALKTVEASKKTELDANAYAACEPIRSIVGKDGKSLKGVLLISKAEAHVKKQVDFLNVLKNQLKAIDLPSIESNHEEALTALAKKEQEISTSQRTVNRLDKRIAERSAEEIKAAQRRIDEQRSMPPGYCARSKEEADGVCTFYKEAAIQIATHQTEAEILKIRDDLQEEYEAEVTLHKELEDQLPFLQEREQSARKRLEDTHLLAEQKREEIATCAAELKSAKAILAVAIDASEALDTHSAEVKDLKRNIRKSNERQTAIRRELWQDRTDFGDFFESVLRFLMGEEAHGYIHFDNNGLFDLTAKTRSTLSSAAIDALTVIAFDLAAMFWSASGRGHHPRFVIHDSPRVADMSIVPYEAIFEVAQKAETLGKGPPNFQYIITTTQSPPEELKDRHVILELDASTPAGRLFKRDF
jgi:hypothetical protein